MKKVYMTPAIEIESMEEETVLLSGSVTSGKGIGYGGVDADGSRNPDARAFDFESDED